MRQINGMLTPQGLKIRLDGDFCEQLPFKNNKTVYDLLKDTESFVCAGKWFIFIVGILVFNIEIPNNTLFALSFIITIIASLSFWIYPLFMIVRGVSSITQPRIFVTITGWFVDKIVLIVIAFLTVGWQGLLYYAGGYTAATFLGYVLNLYLMKSNYTQFGVPLQSDEKAFIFLSLRYLERVSFLEWIKAYYNYLNPEQQSTNI